MAPGDRSRTAASVPRPAGGAAGRQPADGDDPRPAAVAGDASVRGGGHAGEPGGFDRERLALGIRQPWAELILRGRKTLEIRSRSTDVRGPIYVYAAKTLSDVPEAAERCVEEGFGIESPPRGRIVGSVSIVGCRRATPADAAASCVPARLLAGKFAWELADAVRLPEPVKPRFLPYGVWFYPFKRRGGRR